MNRPNVLFRVVLRHWTHQAARRVIVGRSRSRRAEDGRFTSAEVKDLVRDTWRIFDKKAPLLPEQPTAGTRLNLRLSCLTLACFQALLRRGTERGYAIEITSDLAWTFYAKWAALGRLLRGRGITTHLGHLEAGETVPLLFPFNPPGYVAKWVPVEHGVGYDMVRCPVAEYFRSHDAADVCVSSWCNLDFPLGEMLGQKLTREKTLVLGDDRCTFRWTARSVPVFRDPGGRR
jgi:L-2-amino-thiazoline-4-carboxylic acid hydrolase